MEDSIETRAPKLGTREDSLRYIDIQHLKWVVYLDLSKPRNSKMLSGGSSENPTLAQDLRSARNVSSVKQAPVGLAELHCLMRLLP